MVVMCKWKNELGKHLKKSYVVMYTVLIGVNFCNRILTS